MVVVIELTKDLGMLRVGLVVQPVRVGDVDYNCDGIIAATQEAKGQGVQVLAFPEMVLTGYTIGDLIQQQALLEKAENSLARLLQATSNVAALIVIGMPLAVEQRIYNCAVILNSGKIIGVIPKTLLPGYKEYYETRWFTSSRQSSVDAVRLLNQSVPFGTDLLCRINGNDAAVIGVEICEDLWVPLAPHEYQALAGATVLVNISASNEILGKADWRRNMVVSESGRCLAGYCYVSCGSGESSNDVVFSGHAIIAENGVILQESKRLAVDKQLLVADLDLERMVHDRRVQTSFSDNSRQWQDFRLIDVRVSDTATNGLCRTFEARPFVPADPGRRAERCGEIFSMQVAALAQKLNGVNLKHIVLGVSGGLDSTLALLVAVKTMDYLGLPHENIHACTLPGFGTTRRTKGNAVKLCRTLGVTFENVNITETCKRHLADLSHSPSDDIVFENVQARYRTELLFNKANQIKAVMLGTGDLTEIALGWATFAGDQMSHYHVNASVPKTLVQYLVRWVADEELASSRAQPVLYDILKTPISPELLPPENGRIVQVSEQIIGPVELADFYLYPFIRFGMAPGKILFLANEVRQRGLFDGNYSLEDLYRWLKSFIERFFTNQFKRNIFPEGPKVGSVSLSPRGDWRMPSDARPKLWLESLDTMYAKLKQQRKK